MRYGPHEVTEKNRALVRALAQVGVTQAMIGAKLKIDQTTLRKHYREDIDAGRADGLAQVGSALFKNATRDNNVIAQIFYLKAQGNWNDKPTEINVNHTHTMVSHEDRLALLERGPSALIEGEVADDDADDEAA